MKMENTWAKLFFIHFHGWANNHNLWRPYPDLLYQSTHSKQHRNLRRSLGGSTSNWKKSQGRERRTISSPRSTNFALNKNDIDQSFFKKRRIVHREFALQRNRVRSGLYSQVLDSLLKRIARVKPWFWFALLDSPSAHCATYCSVCWRIAVWLTSAVHLNHLTSPQPNTFYKLNNSPEKEEYFGTSKRSIKL
jgi:hypothetical protein